MKQAIVIMHGMGEQVPMSTLHSFVNSVWTTDKNLVDPGKPDPNTGGPRQENVSWAKPDARNNSTELRRVTTEKDASGNYTDFYEYYWAHMMQGNTWEHFKTWIWDLLLRNPFKRVPARVFHAWAVLWLIALIVIVTTLYGFWPKAASPKPWVSFVLSLMGLGLAAFVSNVLIKRFGDVARYVKAWPPNVAKRHAIRQAGVDLLKKLIDSKDSKGNEEYDRIVVVAHSLGTIVAYDILTMVFGHYNKDFESTQTQPERDKLEQMIRDARRSGRLEIDGFQKQQAAALSEAREHGTPWKVTDFITLGSPLTHAEFLLAESLDDLRMRQNQRNLPTCPPVLEYDGTTKLDHFTYSGKSDRKPVDPRIPHHAAPFGYTRWTNLYSPEKCIVKGDLISGPVGEAFGSKQETGVIQGIRDIAVLPRLDEQGQVAPGHRRSGFSHNNYWNMGKGTETDPVEVPHHIEELRSALGILRNDQPAP